MDANRRGGQAGGDWPRTASSPVLEGTSPEKLMTAHEIEHRPCVVDRTGEAVDDDARSVRAHRGQFGQQRVLGIALVRPRAAMHDDRLAVSAASSRLRRRLVN
jgi:hypothetical protein